MGLPADQMQALLARVQEMEGASEDNASDYEDNDVVDQSSSDSGESNEDAQEAGSNNEPSGKNGEKPRDPKNGKFVTGKRGPPKSEPEVQRMGQEPVSAPSKAKAEQSNVNGIPVDPNQWPDHPIPVSRFKPVLQERNALRDQMQQFQRELQARDEEIRRLRSWQPAQPQAEQNQAYDPLGLFGGQEPQATSGLSPEVQQRLAKLDHLEREVQSLATARAVEQLKSEIGAVISKYPETVTMEDMRDALRLNPRADMEDLAEALHHRALNWMNRGRLASQQAPAQQAAPRSPAPPTPPRPRNTGGTGSANVESEVRSATKDKTSRLNAITERLKSLGR